jgi:hypothetical protein
MGWLSDFFKRDKPEVREYCVTKPIKIHLCNYAAFDMYKEVYGADSGFNAWGFTDPSTGDIYVLASRGDPSIPRDLEVFGHEIWHVVEPGGNLH